MKTFLSLIILSGFFGLACFGADQVVLAWEDNSSDESGFKIERAADDGPFVPLDSVAADTVGYVDSTVERGKEYAYRVKAYNEIGDSPYSNVARAGYVSRLTNMSVLTGDVGAGNTLTVGFVTDGAATKSILVRGIGPTLGTAFGISDALNDPVLNLYSGSNPSPIDTNDDWGKAANSTQIAAAASSVGAFPLPPNSQDAALLAVLRRGTYSAKLTGKEDASGVVLLELYDQDSIYTTRLRNVSALREVGAGSKALTIGFVIAGNNRKKVLIRAIGPTLVAPSINVPGVLLRDPVLRLYRGGVLLMENDNWGGTEVLKEAFRATAAFALDDESRDAALVETLAPGEYTAEVSSTTSQAGIAMIEVYEVP